MVGNCRQNLLDHRIILNQHHLKHLMNEYVQHYHEDRTHLALAKRTPAGRKARTNSVADRKIVSMPRLPGLRHRYYLAVGYLASNIPSQSKE
jgi:hypothetical protein